MYLRVLLWRCLSTNITVILCLRRLAGEGHGGIQSAGGAASRPDAAEPAGQPAGLRLGLPADQTPDPPAAPPGGQHQHHVVLVTPRDVAGCCLCVTSVNVCKRVCPPSRGLVSLLSFLSE